VELSRDGAAVLLLEARDRIGGRIWTIRDGFAAAQHAEAGGEFIDEDQEEIKRLARNLNLDLVPVLKRGFAFARKQAGGAAPLITSGTELWPVLHRRLSPLIRAYRLADERWDSAVAHQLAKISVAEWLRSIGAAKELGALMTGLRGFFLLDPADLPLLALVDQLIAGTPGQGKLYRVKGGNDQLAQGLSTFLGEHIRLGAEAVEILQSPKNVFVTVRHRNGKEARLRADYAVLAVPASVLRYLRFDPPLPPQLRQAVTALSYGKATKTLLQFTRRFWRGGRRAQAYATDFPVGTMWDGNEEQPGRSGILTLLAGGNASNATQESMAAGGIERILSALHWLGPAPRTLLNFKQITWENDPWAGGGYAAFTTAYDPALRQWLTQPHGRCFFAGEHTSFRWQGYMNGAVESGLRAAFDVITMAQGSAWNRPPGDPA
jgi:monoamine oxidase